MNETQKNMQDPVPSVETANRAKRRAAGAMLFISVVALLILSFAYLDALHDDEVKNRFEVTIAATGAEGGWRHKAGLLGAFALFLVPVVRNVALFRLPDAALRKWAAASTMLWLAIVLWRGALFLP